MTDRERLIAWMAGTPPCPDGQAPYSCNGCRYVYGKGACDEIALVADIMIANGVVVREKGEWKPVKYNAHCSCGKSYGTYHYECQVCHRVSYAQPYGLNFCPNCGADMRKGEGDG